MQNHFRSTEFNIAANDLETEPGLVLTLPFTSCETLLLMFYYFVKQKTVILFLSSY